jgi:hypothetical protein
MFSKEMKIAGFDEELWNAMQNEVRRQEEHIELIASENYASPRVMEAQGSVLTNKYAEGIRVNVIMADVNISGQGTVWRGLCQCPAPFGFAGKRGRVPGPAATGRYHSRYEPGPWRPFDPRCQG